MSVSGDNKLGAVLIHSSGGWVDSTGVYGYNSSHTRSVHTNLLPLHVIKFAC